MVQWNTELNLLEYSRKQKKLMTFSYVLGWPATRLQSHYEETAHF